MYIYMWVCLSPYVYVREHISSTCLRVCACAYVRVSVRRERRDARDHKTYIYMCMCEHICIGMSAYIDSMSYIYISIYIYI